jgi:hypothetical protein
MPRSVVGLAWRPTGRHWRYVPGHWRHAGPRPGFPRFRASRRGPRTDALRPSGGGVTRSFYAPSWDDGGPAPPELPAGDVDRCASRDVSPRRIIAMCSRRV